MKKSQKIYAEWRQLIESTEGRDMTDDELSRAAQFEKDFKAAKADEEATDARRGALAAVRQQANVETIEEFALSPTQRIASLPGFQRPSGNKTRLGDVIRAQLGTGGLSAEQVTHTGSLGGHTVPTFVSADVMDKMRAKTPFIRAGVRTYVMRSAQEVLPIVQEDGTFKTKAQNAAIEPSSIVFAAATLQAITKTLMIEVAVELTEDNNAFDDLAEDVIASAGAVEMSRLIANGSGVGEPLGLFTDANIPEISGAALASWGPLARAGQAVRTQNFEPSPFIVTSPGGIGAFDALVEGGGSGQPLRRPPSLEGVTFLDTTSVSEAGGVTSAVAGDFSQYILGVRTPLVIEATRTGGEAFSKLQVLIRAYMRIDGFAVRRNAFARVVNIPVPAIA